MPVLNCDPWRRRFYDSHPCPDDLVIALHDPDAYRMNPRHNRIYNKLWLAERQGLDCAPDGIAPVSYPVFCKPIYNLRSMGIASRRADGPGALAAAMAPGMMWCELLEGRHLSTDVAVENGRPIWMCHAEGIPTRQGMFDYWILRPDPEAGLEAYLAGFVREHMPGYTGVMNFETIGGRIIEAHLRYAEQWLDLYGEGFLPAVYALYRGAGWRDGATPRVTGYSLALFGETRRYGKPPPAVVAELEATPGVSGLELPFHETGRPEAHANPPGGFRLALINGTDLAACRAVRARLAGHFGVEAPPAVCEGPGSAAIPAATPAVAGAAP